MSETQWNPFRHHNETMQFFRDLSSRNNDSNKAHVERELKNDNHRNQLQCTNKSRYILATCNIFHDKKRAYESCKFNVNPKVYIRSEYKYNICTRDVNMMEEKDIYI